MLYILDIFGTFAFAVSGAFRAVKYELDLVGVLTLATVTGIAGGIIRDTCLGATPPTALMDPLYVIVCVIGGIGVFFAAPKIAKRWDYVMIADAIGLSVFTAIGADKAETCSAIPLTIPLMAVITACGGGLVRDLLVTEIPSILNKDFYASASFIGGSLFMLLEYLDINHEIRIFLTIIATFALRILAMKYKISLPKVKALPSSPSQISKNNKKSKT